MSINVVISMDSALADKLDSIINLLSTFNMQNKQVETFVEKADIKTDKTRDDVETAKTANDSAVVYTTEGSAKSSFKYTVDDIISAMQNLAAKKGKQEAKQILEKYNASRVSELEEDAYHDFIKDIEGMI